MAAVHPDGDTGDAHRHAKPSLKDLAKRAIPERRDEDTSHQATFQHLTEVVNEGLSLEEKVKQVKEQANRPSPLKRAGTTKGRNGMLQEEEEAKPHHGGITGIMFHEPTQDTVWLGASRYCVHPEGKLFLR